MFEKLLALLGIKPVDVPANQPQDALKTHHQITAQQTPSNKSEAKPEAGVAYLLNEKIQHLIEQNQVFKKTTTLLAVLAIVLSCGLIWASQQPKEKPYLMMLDNGGRVLAKNKATENLNGEQLEVIKTNRTIDVITALKTVSVDRKLQKKMLDEMFNFILPSSEADKKLRKYLQNPETDPYKLAEKFTITVEFQNVFPVSYGENNSAYQIEWREHWSDHQGNHLRTDEYKGAVLYEVHKPKDGDTMQKNPIGFFIKDVTMNKTIGKQKGVD
jgi:type IV secretion system protein TrbF